MYINVHVSHYKSTNYTNISCDSSCSLQAMKSDLSRGHILRS